MYGLEKNITNTVASYHNLSTTSPLYTVIKLFSACYSRSLSLFAFLIIALEKVDGNGRNRHGTHLTHIILLVVNWWLAVGFKAGLRYIYR